jgi:hypothetical protein
MRPDKKINCFEKCRQFRESFYSLYINAFGTGVDKYKYENILQQRKLEKIAPLDSPEKFKSAPMERSKTQKIGDSGYRIMPVVSNQDEGEC